MSRAVLGRVGGGGGDSRGEEKVRVDGGPAPLGTRDGRVEEFEAGGDAMVVDDVGVHGREFVADDGVGG